MSLNKNQNKAINFIWLLNALTILTLLVLVIRSWNIATIPYFVSIQALSILGIILILSGAYVANSSLWLFGTLPYGTILLLAGSAYSVQSATIVLLLSLPIQAVLFALPHIKRERKWAILALICFAASTAYPYIFTSTHTHDQSPYTQQCINAGYVGSNDDTCY